MRGDNRSSAALRMDEDQLGHSDRRVVEVVGVEAPSATRGADRDSRLAGRAQRAPGPSKNDPRRASTLEPHDEIGVPSLGDLAPRVLYRARHLEPGAARNRRGRRREKASPPPPRAARDVVSRPRRRSPAFRVGVS